MNSPQSKQLVLAAGGVATLAALVFVLGAVGGGRADRPADLPTARRLATPVVAQVFDAVETADLPTGAELVAGLTPQSPADEMVKTAATGKVIERAAQERPTNPEAADRAYEELGRTGPKESQDLYKAAADRKTTPAEKVAAIKTGIEQVRQAYKQVKDAELDALGREMKETAAKLKTAKGPERKQLVEKLDKTTKKLNEKTKAAAQSGNADTVVSAVAGAASVLGEVATLSETWEERDDAQKVAGICGILGTACLTVAMFLPPPANAIVAAIGAVLKVLEFLIPALFGGGKKSGGGDGKNEDPNKKPEPGKPTAGKPGNQPGNGAGTTPPPSGSGKPRKPGTMSVGEVAGVIKGELDKHTSGTPAQLHHRAAEAGVPADTPNRGDVIRQVEEKLAAEKLTDLDVIALRTAEILESLGVSRPAGPRCIVR